ncbi:probable E3 ubiquitin-protein ligase HECTD2 [Dendronephthya gigantea]|uniref:probable E3 ubiquitin-protein ligase HECTD2 n=1 Tax=Dendronephthya gigantea TaxID=151771 RepID=UPI00106C1F11|nr:probable E3 ubiquitin-protein ligase HECTD2 [Dendronephthya gigantea]
MAKASQASDSDDRGRGRFLPSIRNPVFNPSDDEEITVTVSAKEESRSKNNGRGKRSFNSIRKFFSSERSTRQTPDNSPSSTPSLPPLSPQPPPRRDAQNTPPEPLRTRARALRDSAKRKFISVETNLRGITIDSRSGTPVSSSSSSSGSEVWNPEKLDTTTDDTSSSATNSQSTDKIEDKENENGGSDSKETSTQLACGESENPTENEMKNIKMFTNTFDLKKEFKKAKAAKDYSTIVDFIKAAFSSLRNLSEIYKASEFDPKCGINSIFVNVTFDILMALPSDHRKTVLKSIVNCLLSNIKKKQNDEDLPGYLILLQNPQFDSCSSYVIFSHLLRQVSSLSDNQHHTLVSWMTWLPISCFKGMIRRLREFVSVALFPNLEDDLPASPEKMRFWVPSAVKVLALLNASNWLNNKPIVSYAYMYIDILDNMNLTKEYDNWQYRTGTFTFCQYPFLLTLSAKRYILQKDSEAQMIEIARKSLLLGVKKREPPAVSMLFFNLRVRRDHLISDSLNEISHKRNDLKKKLKVTFVGEPGVDMGGLTKEWFMLLIRKVFRPEFGMFRYDEKSSCYWFTNMAVDNLAEFNLVGVLMGLAVYNSTILDIRFPLCCYKKLLSPAVVPGDKNATVGVANLDLTDLKEVVPDLAKGLQGLLNYEGDVEDDMCQTFQVSSTVFGSVVTENLKENGHLIPVTNENREEYVDLYVDYILNKSIYRQFDAFYRGFHSVCASNALILLRPEEIEMLVCGNPDFDMRALSKVTIYDGFSKRDATIRYFWEIVGKFSNSLKRKLLRFCTGSDRIPVGGMAEMEFKITRMANVSDEMLPMAHTCFNQLCLPPYKTRQQLKTKLTIAISNSEGFGIE